MNISIVIPVYNVENYVHDSIISALSQISSNSEIIAVNDASSDKSLSIINKIAEIDERLRIISLEKNHGLGYARNLGIEKSTKDFILFLDSDDLLKKGAIKSINLNYTGEDILVYNHDLLWENEILTENPKRFEKLDGEIFNKKDFLSISKLLENTPVAWNKLYKKNFLIKNNIRFPDGLYEDISFYWDVLLLADSIKVINKSCYLYRQRDGSILLSQSDKHIDLITQYERLYTSLKDLSYISVLDRIFLSHAFAVIFTKSERLTPLARRKLIIGTSNIIKKNKLLKRIINLKFKSRIYCLLFALVPHFIIERISTFIGIKNAKKK